MHYFTLEKRLETTKAVNSHYKICVNPKTQQFNS